MRRFAFASIALAALATYLACGGDDSSTPVPTPDASADTNLPDTSPMPDVADVNVPDTAPEEVIFAATHTQLFRFDPGARTLSLVGTFSCAADIVLDIAVNGAGQIWGVTGQGLVSIDPKTAACYPIATGEYPEGIAFLPAEMFDAGPDAEALVGYKYSQYVRIDPATGAETPIGSLSPNDAGYGGVGISGDIVAEGTTHLFITALQDPQGDALLQVDPSTGKATQVVGQTPSIGLVGLGQWAGTGYAFSEEGKIYSMSFAKGGLTQVYPPLDAGAPDADASLSFSGAGVTTRAPGK